jgi:hypothetical protein
MIEVFIPDYIIQILNSQHGWISIVIINNRCYAWGFQSRFSATAIIFINGHDLFHNEGNSPESLQAYDPAVGGYIIQVEITSNMQVPCHCQHAPWHLGANAKLFFAHLIEDPTHHIIMSRPLGATRYCSNLHHHIYKVPAHYCIMTRPLGATLVEVFMSIR